MTYRQFDNVWLCTRSQFQRQRYGGGTVETYDADDIATQDYYIQQASADIVDRVLYQLPLPYVATLRFDAPHSYEHGRIMGYDPAYRYVLHVGDDAPLLAVTSLTNGDGTVIAASDYVLEPANAFPLFKIRIKSTSVQVFDYTDTWEQAIHVTGVWGYVPHYPSCWVDSGATVPVGDLSASATTLTLSTPADAAAFWVGDYLHINDETLLVTETSVATGVLTLVRGVLGATATDHLAGATIRRFVQIRQIATETARYASALYNRDRGVYDGGGVDTEDVLTSVRDRLAGHRRVNV